MKQDWQEISGITNYNKFVSGQQDAHFRGKVIKDEKGEPINHISFKIKTGHLSFDKPNRETFRKTDKEKAKLANEKVLWRNAMREQCGEHWRTIMKKVGIQNATKDIEIIRQINHLKRVMG